MGNLEDEVRDFLGEYKRELDFCTAEFANVYGHCDAVLFESKEVHTLEQECSQREKEFIVLKERINQEREITLEKEKEKEELKKRLQEIESAIEEEEKKLEILKKKNQETAEKEAKEFDLITRSLGLRISRTNHNTLVFTFTQIQESDPERKYMVELCITEKNEYRLIQTVPPIKNLDVYEAKLNETNNFTSFVIFVSLL
ncbi:Kinetochore protein Spc25 [Armadillidium vulgare]|nr:Kinetochore protein Spc25 [Armadillidium vulgare]